MAARRRVLSVALATTLLIASVALSGCIAPAIPKAELDAGKTPRKHPKLTEAQQHNCRGCHREQRAVTKK